jgi:hypothetical protein
MLDSHGLNFICFIKSELPEDSGTLPAQNRSPRVAGVPPRFPFLIVPAAIGVMFTSLAARTLYFNRSEAATFAEASETAERHRTAAERLNDLEKRNRTEGEALDDFSIGRISSFLKSYGEMRKGEQFVMGEVRARARERIRWGASLCLLALALLVAPVAWRRPRIRAPG